MVKNTGVEYEILTKLILGQAHEQDGVKALRAEHNVTLQGISNTHQIDVYLEFEVGGIRHSVAVQCKDWRNAVKQEQMQAFCFVLADLPAQPRGVYVTRKGYQAGAKKLARDKGIVLYTLREVTEKDLKDLTIIRRIEVKLTGLHPLTSEPRVTLHDDWLRAERRRIGVPDGEPFTLTVDGDEQSIHLYNEDKTPRQTLYEFKQTLFPSRTDEVPLQTVAHCFEEPTYFPTKGDPRVPFMRVASIANDLQLLKTTTSHVIEVQGEDIAAYIIQDILAERTGLIDRELRIRFTDQE